MGEFAVTAAREGAWFLITSLACTVIEIAWRGERQSVLSRIKAVAFWSVYILASAGVALIGAWLTRDMDPLLALDFRAQSDSWAEVIAAYTVLPFAGAFVRDFFYYWFHRAQHAIPVLWRFHAVHHSIRELNAFSNYHHALEELFRLPLMVLPLQLLIHIEVEQVVIVAVLLRIWGQFIHTNSPLSLGPLRYVFCEPRFHRIHHSLEERHWNRNFASQFPLFDVLFGTAYFPRAGEYPRTGLADRPEPVTVRQYLWPT